MKCQASITKHIDNMSGLASTTFGFLLLGYARVDKQHQTKAKDINTTQAVSPNTITKQARGGIKTTDKDIRNHIGVMKTM